MTGPDVTGVGEYAEKAARDAGLLSDRVRHEEHLWLSGVRRDPNGEVRFIPSNPDHGMSGTYAGQVTASIDAMLAEARAEERERIALDLHERAQSVTWWLSHTGLARKDAFETAARIARGEAT